MRTSPTTNQTHNPRRVAATGAKRKWLGGHVRAWHAAPLPLCRARSTRAFTLTEILVIVALIGLLASASGSVAYGTYKRYLVEKAARQLYLAARYARLFAVEQHMLCRLVIDKTNRGFFVMFDQPNAPTEEGASRIIANRYTRPTEFPGDVAFEQVNVLSAYEGAPEGIKDAAVISFYPDGTADMSAIQVGDGLNHFAVYVAAATGKAHVEFGEAAQAPLEVVDLDMEGY